MADNGMFLREAFVRVSASADPAQFRSQTQRAIDQGLAGISPTITPQLGTEKAKQQAEVLRGQLKATFDKLSGTLNLDTADARLQLAKFGASADSLQRKLSREKISLADVDKASLQLLGLEAQADRLSDKLNNVKVKVPPVAVPGASGGGGISSIPILGTIAENPEIAAGGAAIAGALSPFIAQGISISMIAGFGAGIAGIAALGASKTALVQQTFDNLKTAANKDLSEIGAPFVPILTGLVYEAQGVLGELTPVFTKAAATIGKALGPFASTLEAAFAQPSVQTAIQNIAKAFGSLLTAATPGLAANIGKIAGEVSDLADNVGKNPRAFADFIGVLSDIAEFSIRALSGLDKAANWIEGHWAQIGPALEQPFVVFSHSEQIVKATIDGIKAVFGTGLPDAITLLDIFRNNARLVWDQVELDALHMASDITGIMGKLPGPLGAPFRTAHAAIANDLAGIAANVATTEAQINADWAKIHDTAVITVHADGTFNVGSTGLKGEAAGGLITGGIPGRDSVLAKLMPGEVVIPTSLVNSGAVDHLRGHLPGFAAGGVVGSYSGNVPGLGPWMGAESVLALKALEAATAAATKTAIHTAQAAAQAGSAAAGPGGGAPAANAALARSLYSSQLTPAIWTAWNNVAMRESGWNQFAQNPTSPAYGIPQADPPSKMPLAAQRAGGSNPTAQIRWMWNYMAGRYGGPIGAWQEELAIGSYAAGTPGAARGWAVVGERGPELVKMHGGEQVISNHAMRGYAKGTGTPKQQAAWLAELAKDVTAENKLVAARTKHRKALALGIYQAELYDIQHPHDKAGPAKLRQLEKANTAYLNASGKPIVKLQKEVALLRALTGNPAAVKYGGAPATSTAGTGTSTSGTSSAGGSSAAGTSSAASAAQLAAEQRLSAQELAEFAQGILPSAGGVTAAGIGLGSASGATATSLPGASTGGIGSMFPSAATRAGSAQGAPAGNGAAMGTGQILARLDALIAVTRAAPGMNTAGFQSVMGGVARGARQGARFNTRG